MIDNYSATRAGAAEPVVRDELVSGAADNVVLLVGDPNIELTGDHEYELRYEIRGLLHAPDGMPELWWDAIGDESTVPVDHATVTVTAPGQLGLVRRVVVNDVGPDDPCTRAEARGGTARFSADELDGGATMNVTVALPGTVTVPPPIIRAEPREPGLSGLAVVGIVVLSGLGLLVLGIVYHRTRDRYFVGVIPGLLPYRKVTARQKRRLFARTEAGAVRFDPPDGVPAALCGVILRKKADHGAVRGEVAGYEQPVLDALADPLTLPGNSGDTQEFRAAVGKLRAGLVAEAVERRWFTRNPRDTYRGCGCLLLIALPGRTAVGTAVFEQVLDFRRYLETAEADELTDRERRIVFDRHLPYAQAFGLANHWTARFAEVGEIVPNDRHG